jgi:E3 ubiquitin-protein ligase DOA10
VKEDKQRRGSAPVHEILRSVESNSFSDSEEGEEISGLDASGVSTKERSAHGSDKKIAAGDKNEGDESDEEKNSFNQFLSEMEEGDEENEISIVANP